MQSLSYYDIIISVKRKRYKDMTKEFMEGVKTIDTEALMFMHEFAMEQRKICLENQKELDEKIDAIREELIRRNSK